MVQPGSGPDHNNQPEARSARTLNATILKNNKGKTEQERQELIGIIARGGSRDQLEDAAILLSKNIAPSSPDLHECLCSLVSVLMQENLSLFQQIAVRMATKAVHTQMKNQLMFVAFEDSVAEKKERAEKQLPALEIIKSLQELRPQALLRHDLTTLAFHLESLEKMQISQAPKDQIIEKITGTRTIIEEFLQKEHFALLTPKLLESMRDIAHDPASQAGANAGILREYYLHLKSVDEVGKLCLKILQEQENSLGKLDHLDDFDRTRVRISAARILKEFKHISNPVREEYARVTGQILPTLASAIPDRWLTRELTSEAA